MNINLIHNLMDKGKVELNMKTFLLLIIIVFPFQTYASACRCTCDPTDYRLCASDYDLDNPCNGVCPSQGSLIAPIRTACPETQVVNPMTGLTEWRTLCEE